MTKSQGNYPLTLPSISDVEHVVNNIDLLSGWLLDLTDNRDSAVIFENICENQFQYTFARKILDVLVEALDNVVESNETVTDIIEHVLSATGGGTLLVFVDTSDDQE